LNGTHKLLVYADVNLLGRNTNIIQENTETLLNGNMKVCLEVIAEKKICDMFIFPPDCTSETLYEVDESLENVSKFRYFSMMVTDQNCIHEEMKSRLNSV
jgi:hypothetical protein